MVIDITNKATLQGNIRRNIQTKSTIITDNYNGCLRLKSFNHKTVNHSDEKIFANDLAHTNNIESV